MHKLDMSSPLTLELEGGLTAHVVPLDPCIARLYFTVGGVCEAAPPAGVRVCYFEGGEKSLKPWRDSFFLVWLHDYSLWVGQRQYRLLRSRHLVEASE